jgi:phosphoserine phosphatase
VRHDDRVPLDPTPRFPPAPAAPAARAVLTVSGVDRPGVTAQLFAALAESADGVPALEVLDVEQVVVQGHLVLGVVVGSLAVGAAPAADERTLLAHLGRLAADVAAAVLSRSPSRVTDRTT